MVQSMITVDASLRDKSNGKEAVDSQEWEEQYIDGVAFQWGEGNYSCDCNRAGFMYGHDTYDESKYNCSTELIECLRVVRRDTGEVLYKGDEP